MSFSYARNNCSLGFLKSTFLAPRGEIIVFFLRFLSPPCEPLPAGHAVTIVGYGTTRWVWMTRQDDSISFVHV